MQDANIVKPPNRKTGRFNSCLVKFIWGIKDGSEIW